MRRQFVYLAIILDVFTRSLRGWHLGRTLSSELALAALDRALAQRRPEIHHSDQGVQYAAQGYVDRLEAIDIQVSMAAVGQPTEKDYALYCTSLALSSATSANRRRSANGRP